MVDVGGGVMRIKASSGLGRCLVMGAFMRLAEALSLRYAGVFPSPVVTRGLLFDVAGTEFPVTQSVMDFGMVAHSGRTL